MTPRERLLAAMAGKIPDRVPCAPDTNWTIPVRLKNLPSWQVYYYNDPPIWKAYNDCVKYYGVDGFSHHGIYEIPLHPDCEEKKEIIFQNEEKIVVRTTFRSPAGELTQEETYLRNEPPTPTKRYIADFVKQYEAVRYLFFGDVKNISFKTYETIRKDMGNHGAVGMCMYLPTLLHMWREPVEACYFDYFEHHSLVCRFMEEWTDYLINIAHAIIRSNCKPDFIFFPNSGAITLQSEDIMREFTLPALKKLTKLFKAAGILTSLHSCGKERALVEAAATETDLDCIDPLEIPPMGDCDFKEIKEKFGKKLTLKGNLHTTNVMLMMKPEEVERVAIELLEIGKPGGRFILSTGDQCGRNTPDENIFKLVEVCEKYGRYDRQ